MHCATGGEAGYGHRAESAVAEGLGTVCRIATLEGTTPSISLALAKNLTS
jgi:hypothetical protein